MEKDEVLTDGVWALGNPYYSEEDNLEYGVKRSGGDVLLSRILSFFVIVLIATLIIFCYTRS